jgi:hypothetical protein
MMPFEGEIRQREARSVGFRPNSWRWGKRLLVVGCLSVPSAVALFACDDPVHLPGLQNELPNRVGGQVAFVSTGSGTGGTTTTTTGTAGSVAASDAGPALSLCDCAAALNAGVSVCKSCENSMCSGVYTQCLQAPASECSAGIQCVMGCSANDGLCISTCLQVSPAYATLIECVLSSCGASCGWSPPETCSYDAGTD